MKIHPCLRWEMWRPLSWHDVSTSSWNAIYPSLSIWSVGVPRDTATQFQRPTGGNGNKIMHYHCILTYTNLQVRNSRVAEQALKWKKYCDDNQFSIPYHPLATTVYLSDNCKWWWGGPITLAGIVMLRLGSAWIPRLRLGFWEPGACISQSPSLKPKCRPAWAWAAAFHSNYIMKKKVQKYLKY